jgi:hypothetical protein
VSNGLIHFIRFLEDLFDNYVESINLFSGEQYFQVRAGLAQNNVNEESVEESIRSDQICNVYCPANVDISIDVVHQRWQCRSDAAQHCDYCTPIGAVNIFISSLWLV